MWEGPLEGEGKYLGDCAPCFRFCAGSNHEGLEGWITVLCVRFQLGVHVGGGHTPFSAQLWVKPTRGIAGHGDGGLIHRV